MHDARMSALTASQSRNAHRGRRVCPMKLPTGVGRSARIVTRRWHRLEAGQARHVLDLTIRQWVSIVSSGDFGGGLSCHLHIAAFGSIRLFNRLSS